MANEIKVIQYLELRKQLVGSGPKTVTKLPDNDLPRYIDMSGNAIVRTIQALTATAEDLELGEVTIGGLMIFRNLDATNTIYVLDSTDTTVLFEIPPLEIAGPLRLETGFSGTPQVKAAAATATLEVLLLED